MDFSDIINLRDYSPETPPGVMREFLDGKIHEDFSNEMRIRVEALRDFLEDSKGNQYIEAQGAVKFARMVMGIFEDLYQNSLTDSEGEQDE